VEKLFSTPVSGRTAEGTYLVEISGQAITPTAIHRNKLKFTDRAFSQYRPFGMNCLYFSYFLQYWNISNGRSKLNCRHNTIVRLTVTDSWSPALKILPILVNIIYDYVVHKWNIVVTAMAIGQRCIEVWRLLYYFVGNNGLPFVDRQKIVRIFVSCYCWI